MSVWEKEKKKAQQWRSADNSLAGAGRSRQIVARRIESEVVFNGIIRESTQKTKNDSDYR